MAIIKCPECNAPVSDQAPICPTCGVEIKGKITICTTCNNAYLTEKEECPKCASEKNTTEITPVKGTSLNSLFHKKTRTPKRLLFCLHSSSHFLFAQRSYIYIAMHKRRMRKKLTS